MLFIILPLVAGVIFALVLVGSLFVKPERARPKRDLVKFGVIMGGFVAIALIATLHLFLNKGM